MSNLSILLSILGALADQSPQLGVDIHDYHLKSTAGITILNHYGAIEVQGWSLDKVRVEVKKSTNGNLSFEVDQSENKFEIRTTAGKNQFLAEKIKTRSKLPEGGIDLLVRAPAHVPLTLLSKNSKIVLKGWGALTEISASHGDIKIENITSPVTRIACPDCKIRIGDAKGTIKISGGKGNIDLKQIESQDLFIESTSGIVNLEQVSGSGILVTDSGQMRAKKLEGQYAFKSRSAEVLLTETKGSIHGESRSGNIHIEVKEWTSLDKQLISSEEGSIHVSLPPSFSGEIEAVSQMGKLNMDFPLTKTVAKKIYGPEPMNHYMGKAGRGGELLSIQSTKGNIWLLQAI
ncbi:MAG: DUF4097 family beta strand repeat protein [Xanthomonadaceae bacterium]|nr:DUF4097 family beta strand repeat protein [Xanthomonadaceae bacterium]